MKPSMIGFWLAVLGIWLALPDAWAYPPAPDGLIYGLVKDEYGMPLMNAGDTVILQTPGGVQVSAPIQPNLAVGVNYAVNVPMDAGNLPTPYVANALIAGTPYKLYVTVGTTTNLPIEMTGAYSALAKPTQKTLQNLTLGTDLNGDGIPDAWETLFLQSLGINIPLADINPNTDYAHDGRTLLQEYLLGNFPYTPPNNFTITLVSQNAGSALLAFTSMAGHSYSVYGSPDLKNWTLLSFTVPALGPTVQTSYYAASVQVLQFQTVQPAPAPKMQFFRLLLQ